MTPSVLLPWEPPSSRPTRPVPWPGLAVCVLGMIVINDVIVSTAHPATPFGGRRESGWGVTQGAEGLQQMTVPQVVSVRAGRFRPHYDLAAQGPEVQQEMALGFLESGTASP